MAQIQTGQIELEALCARLAPVFIEYLRTHGTAIDRIEETTTLEGITSLPARYNLGGVEKNVLAPLGLLRKGVDEAIGSCDSAAEAANAAAALANAATSKAEAAVVEMAQERTEAIAATNAANSAASKANSATGDLNTIKADLAAAEGERSFAELQRVKAEAIREKAERERGINEAAREVSEAERQEAEEARGEAEDARSQAYAERMKAVDAATDEAKEAAGECRDVTEQIQAQVMYVPRALECAVPECLTLGDKREIIIKARILPAEAAQNVLFIGDDGAVSVTPDGKIKLNHAGESSIHVIPVGNVGLYQTVKITVREPVMRLSCGGGIRLTGNNRLRLG